MYEGVGRPYRSIRRSIYTHLSSRGGAISRATSKAQPSLSRASDKTASERRDEREHYVCRPGNVHIRNSVLRAARDRGKRRRELPEDSENDSCWPSASLIGCFEFTERERERRVDERASRLVLARVRWMFICMRTKCSWSAAAAGVCRERLLNFPSVCGNGSVKRIVVLTFSWGSRCGLRERFDIGEKLDWVGLNENSSVHKRG